MRSPFPLSLFLFAPLLPAACLSSPPPPGGAGAEGDDVASGLDPSGDDAGDGTDASFVSPAWDASSGSRPDSTVVVVPGDTGAPGSPDAAGGEEASCVQPLGPGVLAIDELMIESVAGSGDYGEWLEIESTAACAVNLRGLHGQCPSGSKVRTFDVTIDLWLPPGGRFVVADSADPAINHDLPGTLLTWAGQPGDVLRSEGGTLTLLAGDAIVDSLTWPSFRPVVGASVAFPAGCPPSQRSTWASWQTSSFSWFPGFHGTPGAPNDDVGCPWTGAWDGGPD